MLQINLHSSIIPEAENTQKPEVTMRSPRRRDKIVETNCSFPLHQGWNCKVRGRKLVLASDKTQQTSENDIFGNEGVRSIVSYPDQSEQPILLNKASAVCYSSDLPETGMGYKNSCKCSICLIARNDQNRSENAEMCNCCRCNRAYITNTARAARRKTCAAYQATEYLPYSTDTELSDSLSHPPMKAKLPRLPRPPSHRRAYPQQCECCLYYSFKGNNDAENYAELSTPFRYRPHNSCYYYLQRRYQRNKQVLEGLPYQNNDDYLQLVHELQDTLHSRNRNRVKKAMQEFENKSKQNKPLERPIINYDEPSESEESILRKIDQMRGNIKTCCAEDSCNYCAQRKRGNFGGEGKSKKFGERQRRWTINPDSGDWQKENLRKEGRREPSNEDDLQPSDCPCNCGYRYQ